MEMKFQFYKAPITNTVSRQSMNLLEVHQYITHDAAAKQHTATLRDLLRRVAQGEATEEDARRYKASHFDFVLFSGLFRSRTDAGLFVHSGLLCLDMDHLGGPEAVSALRQRLLQDPCHPTLLLFTSPGGDGLKWVIRIDLTRCPQHLTWFLALEQYVQERYGVAIDRKCSNVSRACFLPHDPDCYIHPALRPASPAVNAGPTTLPAAETALPAGSPTLPTGREPFDPQAWAHRNPHQQPTAPSHQQPAAPSHQQPAAPSHQQPTATSPVATTIDQLAKAISRSKEALPSASSQAAQAAADDPAEAIRYYADLCVSRGIDITAGYDNWLRLGFALSDIFGESGRSMYHDLSRLNSGYHPAQCDDQYSKCLRSKGTGVTYRTFFDLLRRAGIDLSGEARNRRAQQDFAPMTEEMMRGESDKTDKLTKCSTVEIVEKTPIFGFLEEEMTDSSLSVLSVSRGRTFSDKIDLSDWPGFCREVIEGQDTTEDRDKMLLAALNIISGVLPDSLYSLYDGRRIYAPLYNIFYGGYATRKGDLEACRQLLRPIKEKMQRAYAEAKEKYEEELAAWEGTPKGARGKAPAEPVRQSPLIAANSSASAVYRQLDANGGWGLMVETEADSLTIMLSRLEYGDYSDLLRKAHHHELCSMVRVSDKVFIEIEKPRLAVLLTCTGSQLPLLLPPGNVANGLASRFLFYALPDSKVEFRNVFKKSDRAVEDHYQEMGQRVLALHEALLLRKDHPIQFMLSTEQQERFLQMFNAILQEQFYMMGNGIQGFIYRLALECYRYAMVLTALRRLSQSYGSGEPIFLEEESGLICDERDFRIATTIIECLVNHTARVYAVLGSEDQDPFAQSPEKPSATTKKLYDLLPVGREFTTGEAIEIARANHIIDRTAHRILGELVTRFLVLDHPRHGIYIKLRKEARHD